MTIDSLEFGSKQEVRESPQKKKAKIESNSEMRRKESERKLQEWEKTNSGIRGLLDTSGASILEVDGRKLKETKPELYSRLSNLLWTCRWKYCLSYFTHPGDECDGGMVAFENSPGLMRPKDVKHYSAKCRIAIKQYNKNIKNQPLLKLELFSFIRVAFHFGLHSYLTFTACQNGELGTYQAVLDDDWLGDGDVNLVLLRHLEADKIIYIMCLSGAEEEWEKRFGKNWKFCAY